MADSTSGPNAGGELGVALLIRYVRRLKSVCFLPPGDTPT